EGFQNSGQTNHQLGLEMWKGTEYVCRAHEEANIRNLFLSKFLERLREIEKETGFQTKAVAAPMAPADAVSIRPPVPAPVSVPQQLQPSVTQTLPEHPLQNAAQDEYLGVVAADDQAEDKRPSYADECVPEYDADIEALVDRLDDEDQDSNVDGSPIPVVTEFAQPEIATPVHEFANEAATDNPVTLDQSASSDIDAEEIQPAVTELVELGSIGSIVLAEKEPYNFDGCTVTAVVQLLPEAEGVRKCVVSVRTHDFTPRIAIVDVATADALPQISAILGLAFEQYRNELPARAADKMKKEKPAAKKQSKTGSKAAKAATVQPKAATNSETTASAPAPNPETNQSQQGLFAS
ncbi:MAG TPA: hypothetical protein VK612_00635, partial [Pyrinomonadaceae bacterium]|nr:hypothetical protein [Pyrinomonadaceae bacterium]